MMALSVAGFGINFVVGAAKMVVVAAFAAAKIVVAEIVIEVVAFLPTIGLDVASNLHYTC